MRALTDDIRTAVRSLLRQPGYTAVAVLILALGIGVNATVFSVLDTVILRELPYRDADRLVLATSRSYDAFVERRHYERWDFEPWPELAETSREVVSSTPPENCRSVTPFSGHRTAAKARSTPTQSP